jgi:hypothetical protein
MDTPVCRLRQIARVIDVRHKAARKYQQAIVEWQTKTTVHFIAATVPSEKGQKNPLIEAAKEVALSFEGDEAVDSAPRLPVKDERSIEEVIEQGSLVAADRNKVGSFEKLMRGFGG